MPGVADQSSRNGRSFVRPSRKPPESPVALDQPDAFAATPAAVMKTSVPARETVKHVATAGRPCRCPRGRAAALPPIAPYLPCCCSSCSGYETCVAVAANPVRSFLRPQLLVGSTRRIRQEGQRKFIVGEANFCSASRCLAAFAAISYSLRGRSGARRRPGWQGGGWQGGGWQGGGWQGGGWQGGRNG